MKNNIKLLSLITILVTLLAGCVSGSGYDVDITEVISAVKEQLGEDYYPARELDYEEIENLTGITEDMIESMVAEGPMMTMHIDTFIAIKATEDNGDAVAEKLENYKSFLVEESMQYPMNMPKVESAKVLHYDDYVFFLMLGKNNDNMEDASSEEALEFAQNEIQRVEDIITEFFN